MQVHAGYVAHMLDSYNQNINNQTIYTVWAAVDLNWNLTPRLHGHKMCDACAYSDTSEKIAAEVIIIRFHVFTSDRRLFIAVLI